MSRIYSPGGSISGSSEILLQRGRGKCRSICDMGEAGGTCNQFYRRLLPASWRCLPVTRSRHHHEGFWCFSRYKQMQVLDS